MNWRHLQAILWLRWRLSINQWRRAGTFNAVAMIVLSIAALLTAVPLFIGSFALGVYAIPRATPAHLMLAWDALVVVFLFCWSIGLMTELQRGEPLSLSKFLHLPVSANGAFLINYLSSLLSLSLIAFVPIMLGFSLALVYVKGIALLPVLPLLAAFLLMVTALTYQFQGWLASMMNNPRRRRTVIVVTTTLFVLVFQVPNLLNLYAPWGASQRAAESRALVQEMKKLERAFNAHEFDAIEHLRRQNDLLERHKLTTRKARDESMRYWEDKARLVNMILPIGWLPVGVMTAAEGRFLPSLLGLSGMALIGTASLRRAYRTMVGQYQGASTNRKGPPRSAAVAASSEARPDQGRQLLETRIPGLSEPVAAIALGSLRAILRAPEAKMALLTPVIMIAIFGSMMLRGSQGYPELVRPLLAMGAMGFVLLGVLQLAGNQFGVDRDGFRVFVLCAAPRRDILLGKNLAYAPVSLGLGAILMVVVQVLCPMRWDHFLALFPQLLSMFVLFCIFMNFASIYAPAHIAMGSLKPSSVKLSTILLQMGMFLVFVPLTQALTLLPLGTEALLQFLGWTREGIPICLLLSLLECAAAVAVWLLALGWQGALFQAREQRILETVTNRAP